jgi:dihydrofolate reductase
MRNASRVRVYIACSFDGFIAGPGDDLSWLPGADPNASGGPDAVPQPPAAKDVDAAPGSVGYAEFMQQVGALLLGRRTFDVVMGFGGEWPYGNRSVLVATHRPIRANIPNVHAVSGTIEELVATAKQRAGNEDVYLDGGNLIRQALSAGLVDDLIVTLVPELLGQGHPLFAGLEARCSLEFTGYYPFGQGMLQIHARPRGIQST